VSPRIRVLLVDDSAVIRRLLKAALRAQDDIEVCGVAPNGRVALREIDALDPDVVVLDVEMPELDGLGVLKELRRRGRRLPIIMFSTLTERCGATTLEALGHGASDYVRKPTNVTSMAEGIALVEAEIVPKIRALAPRRHPAPPTLMPPPAPAPRPRIAGTVSAVVIAVSTGGPPALTQVIPRLPRDFPVPVLVVQHMPPVFTRLLAERLDRESALEGREAETGAPIRPGTVWIAKGGAHMAVGGDGLPELVLTDAAPENSCRPAADVLFRSAVTRWGGGVCAVVMTGMGRDGCAGARAVRGAGGVVLAQDQASSVVWSMPRAVVTEGLADAVVPLDALAAAIETEARRGRAARTLARAR